MNKPSALKKSVIYFLLTILISWLAVFLIFGNEAIPATVEMQEVIGMVLLLGPTTASLVLTGVYLKKDGLKKLGSRLIKVKVNLKWYLLAILIAPISTIIGLWIFSFFSDHSTPNFLSVEDGLSIVTLGLIGGIFVGLFEEIGWTGFAIPTLSDKYGIFKTGLIVGLVWGLWHFILFWEDDSFNGLWPFLLLIGRLFAWLPAYRILMVWVYSHTKSLFINVLMHLFLVASLAIIDPVLEGNELLIYILIRTVILWSLVVFVLFIERKRKENLQKIEL